MNIHSNDFLGRGWSFPPSFEGGGAYLEMVAGPEDIRQSLHILLSTSLGERIMHDEFGSELNHFMFEELDERLLNNIKRVVSNAIVQYEVRIKLETVEISLSETNQGLLFIHISYSIRSTNSRYNIVYPFFIHEGLIPGINNETS